MLLVLEALWDKAKLLGATGQCPCFEATGHIKRVDRADRALVLPLYDALA